MASRNNDDMPRDIPDPGQSRDLQMALEALRGDLADVPSHALQVVATELAAALCAAYHSCNDAPLERLLATCNGLHPFVRRNLAKRCRDLGIADPRVFDALRAPMARPRAGST